MIELSVSISHKRLEENTKKLLTQTLENGVNGLQGHYKKCPSRNLKESCCF